MGRYKIILVDSDIVSHFYVASRLDKLTEILSPNLIFMVDTVHNELSRCEDRIADIDEWIKSCKITLIPFPYANEKVRMEYYRIKKEYRLTDKGERACMAMAKYGKEILASSNFKDVKPYAYENGIEYIGCIDILYIAWKNSILTEDECDKFISDAIIINKARFPVGKIAQYIPDRDISYFIKHQAL